MFTAISSAMVIGKSIEGKIFVICNVDVAGKRPMLRHFPLYLSRQTGNILSAFTAYTCSVSSGPRILYKRVNLRSI